MSSRGSRVDATLLRRRRPRRRRRELQERLAPRGARVAPDGAFDAETDAAVRAFQDAPRAARRRHLRTRDLGRADRERRSASATGCCTCAGRCCAATTSPSCSAGSTRSASTRAARTASSDRRPKPRSAQFQRDAGLATDGVCGPATIAALERLGLARRRVGRRGARTRGAAARRRAGSRTAAASSSSIPASPRSAPASPAGSGERRGRRARRSGDRRRHRSPRRRTAFGADVFLALGTGARARRALRATSRPSTFRSEARLRDRDRISPTTLGAVLADVERAGRPDVPAPARDAHGRGRVRAVLARRPGRRQPRSRRACPSSRPRSSTGVRRGVEAAARRRSLTSTPRHGRAGRQRSPVRGPSVITR